MTLALILKILGGLISLNCHRMIVAAAKEEGFGWFLFAMLFPGGSIMYSLRSGGDMIRIMLFMLLGGVVVGGGFALQIHDAVKGAQAAAESEFFEPEPEEASLPPTPVTLFSSSKSGTEPPPNWPAHLLPKADRLVLLYKELNRERERLNTANPAAVDEFNRRVDEYAKLKTQFQAELRASK